MAIKSVSFTIEGPPKGKGRPKFARVGNFVRTYTPKDTMTYENVVRFSYLGAAGRPDKPITGPVILTAKFYFAPPTSLSNKKRTVMLSCQGAPVTKKPDLDNLVKAVMDGLNKVAFVDDSQVWSKQTDKRYSDHPRSEITLVWEEDNASN